MNSLSLYVDSALQKKEKDLNNHHRVSLNHQDIKKKDLKRKIYRYARPY
jgi:hypothetical protein